MAKYGNIKVQIDGKTFDSQLEARRYRVLVFMQRAGEISGLTLQPKFLLQEGFMHNGKKILPIYYVADFKYHRNGLMVIEDTKGHRTKDFLLKKKMLLYKYRGINFYEVENHNDTGGIV